MAFDLDEHTEGAVSSKNAYAKRHAARLQAQRMHLHRRHVAAANASPHRSRASVGMARVCMGLPFDARVRFNLLPAPLVAPRRRFDWGPSILVTIVDNPTDDYDDPIARRVRLRAPKTGASR